MKSGLLIALAALTLVTVGCDNKKDDRVAGQSVPARVNTYGAGTSNIIPSTAYVQNIAGTVTGASDDMQFTNLIRSFVSSAKDPNAVGNVSALPYVNGNMTEGFIFTGYVEVFSDGSINTQNANIRVEIWDDLASEMNANNQVYGPIRVSINGAVEGGVAQDGRVSVKFQDQYGSMTLDGRIVGNLFEGTFKFQNLRSYTGQAVTEAEQTLGTFRIDTHGFFSKQ